MTKKLIKFYLTAFGAGHSPIAPGTMGSLFAIVLIYFTQSFGQMTHWIIFISMSALSYFLLNYAKSKNFFQLDDPGWVVQDEVSGIYVTLLIVLLAQPQIQLDLKSLSVIFVFFRAFDILKPWPASYFDRHHTPSSIMHDDIIAGVYAGLASVILFTFL